MIEPNPPRVSVLIPVRNGALYLSAAIESVLRQSFADFELLVIDDGSTDHSGEIAAEHAQQDVRVKVIRRPAQGLVAALNTAIAVANAELLARFDADDLMSPDRLALQVEYLDAHPECIAVGGQTLLVDEDGDPIGPVTSPFAHEAIERELLTGRGLAIVHGSSMLRKQGVAEVGGYREFPGEDLDLFLRLAERGELANLPQTLLYYRKHSHSVTALEQRETIRAARTKIVAAALARRGRTEPPNVRTFFEPDSIDDLYARWAKLAASAGNYRTASKYLRKLIRSRPWAASTWRRVAGVWMRRVAARLPAPLVDRLRSRPRSSDGGSP